MQSETFKEIGLGAGLVIALQIIREVIVSLLKRNGKKESDTSGERSVAEWEQRMERLHERVIENKLLPRMEKLEGMMADVKMAVATLIRWKGAD